MNTPRWAPLALLILTLTACRSWHEDRVEVELRLAPQAPALQDIAIVVGDERMSWATLEAGAALNATFLPTQGADRRLTLLYATPGHTGAPLAWMGPPVGGDASYRIVIQMTAPGQIQARHCLLPCALD
ncbi:MAG TPA: hypothetical protein VFH49_15655 [Aquabacterium sp.]|nr:hypothetical protein [Aquabacterium sp.]